LKTQFSGILFPTTYIVVKWPETDFFTVPNGRGSVTRIRLSRGLPSRARQPAASGSDFPQNGLSTPSEVLGPIGRKPEGKPERRCESKPPSRRQSKPGSACYAGQGGLPATQAAEVRADPVAQDMVIVGVKPVENDNRITTWTSRFDVSAALASGHEGNRFLAKPPRVYNRILDLHLLEAP
jgi:hypothetical protein